MSGASGETLHINKKKVCGGRYLELLFYPASTEPLQTGRSVASAEDAMDQNQPYASSNQENIILKKKVRELQRKIEDLDRKIHQQQTQKLQKGLEALKK